TRRAGRIAFEAVPGPRRARGRRGSGPRGRRAALAHASRAPRLRVGGWRVLDRQGAEAARLRPRAHMRGRLGAGVPLVLRPALPRTRAHVRSSSVTGSPPPIADDRFGQDARASRSPDRGTIAATCPSCAAPTMATFRAGAKTPEGNCG